jgi:hypothetical protein
MFDNRDPYWGQTTGKEELIELFAVVIPWPIMYETLRTRMARNRRSMQGLEVYLKRPHLNFLDDSPYREGALDQSLSFSLRGFRPLSMVDCLIRLILEDVNVMVHYLATFNDRDFRDVCQKRRIEIF